MAGDDDSLGLTIGRVAKEVTRAFDDVLAAAGGSSPAWQVLRALSTGTHRTQADLAAAVGVRQPTLSHHLEEMERAGLVVRERTDGNRRVQVVTVTEPGRQLFLRLRRAAASFDGRLRAGLEDADVAHLRRLLDQLRDNARPD
ncbi:MarR family winged helix-turn-helix transcriptional regulator [Blastococcus tunisiensis]|uniref:MarR family transcriptional regulator, transcriptional regulator for hemolysin n=1 Tax=Blastococcus tunisiensis TaxID=1798228 RepID=A0A1I2LE49_9ACTN|nr:MarR family winged helix-turn-helix transcriptional regulator [Blastococcus sp. DSM 46838]SFF77293.1 MarR family transcriptional regulator, transcriptional regulator for hemolysin [Blastococcus sp. DSM 46838]